MLKSEDAVTVMQQDNHITYLIGSDDVTVCPIIPYHNLVCDFLNDLSLNLFASKEATKFPDVASFAFWCRKANIVKFKKDFEDGKNRLGLGLVFHIAPSNVPVNFAFSFAFGLLAGNASVVRVPSKDFPQTHLICEAIHHVFKNKKYDGIKRTTAFIQYQKNDEITADFSKRCHARIIWGGDETIKNIRQLPIPERAVEIAFADRYSFCILDALSVLKLNDTNLKKLAENFYNDNYLMDQNACSSSHLIIWQGDDKAAAKEKFWAAVAKLAAKKYELTPVQAVDKYTLLCCNAIDLEKEIQFKKYNEYVYCLSLKKLPNQLDYLRGKFGYFYEYETDDLNYLAPYVNIKYQTLTYFGVDKHQLLQFVLDHHLLGIDRIVPIGQALDIQVIWDGYDVIKTLSRVIDVK